MPSNGVNAVLHQALNRSMGQGISHPKFCTCPTYPIQSDDQPFSQSSSLVFLTINVPFHILITLFSHRLVTLLKENLIICTSTRLVLLYQFLSEWSRLTHWGLGMPYGNGDLGQHWFRWWLVAWRHQAITWTSVGLSSVRSSYINLMAISQEIHQSSITKINMKITHLKCH